MTRATSPIRWLRVAYLIATTRRALIVAWILQVLVTIGVVGARFVPDEAGIAPIDRLANDEPDYLARGIALRRHGFEPAFGDAFRMPGYPAIVALAADGDAASTKRTIAIVQVVLALALPWATFFLFRGVLGRRRAVAAGVVVALSPFGLVYALAAEPEAWVLPGVVVVAALASRRSVDAARLFAIGVATATLVLAKPNLVLLLVPIVAARAAAEGIRRGAAQGVVLACVVAACVAPWSVAASRFAGGFTPLSSTGGMNLHIGSGASEPLAWSTGVVRPRSVVCAGAPPVLRAGLCAGPLYDPLGTASLLASITDRSPRGRDHAARRAAARTWRLHPAAAARYGLAKVSYAFGGSGRFRDLPVLALFLSACVAIALGVRRVRFAPLAIFVGGLFGVLAAQAFVFLPNLRFTVPVAMTPALVLLAAVGGSVRRRT